MKITRIAKCIDCSLTKSVYTNRSWRCVMHLEKAIKTETELIKKLKKDYPKMGKAWDIHDTKVRDAYWRRRRLIAQEEPNDPFDIY